MFHQFYKKRLIQGITMFILVTSVTGCSVSSILNKKTKQEEKTETSTEISEQETEMEEMTTEATLEEATTEAFVIPEDHTVSWNPDWKYAEFSEIHSSDTKMYYSHAENRKNVIVAVNAGHGTEGGESVKTLCHPDGSPKVTGGTTSEGATKSSAISSGMTFNDGTEESKATLSMAILLKEALLEDGYDVLMIREEEDTQIDNIARTVFANNNADYHISLHYDGTESDKGVFYLSVPENDSYRSMEPVASHWEEHNALGEALIEGIQEEGIAIFSSGSMEMDLTQTSFSTIPTVDMEIGDAVSDHSEKVQTRLAQGMIKGMDHLLENK